MIDAVNTVQQNNSRALKEAITQSAVSVLVEADERIFNLRNLVLLIHTAESSILQFFQSWLIHKEGNEKKSLVLGGEACKNNW